MANNFKVVVETSVPGPRQIRILAKEQELRGGRARRCHVRAQLYNTEENRVVKSRRGRFDGPCNKQHYNVVLSRLENTTSSLVAKTYTHAFTNARRQIHELS